MCVTDCTGDALEAALAAALDEVVLPALATPSPARQAEVHLHQSLPHPRDAPSAAVLHLTVVDGLLLLCSCCRARTRTLHLVRQAMLALGWLTRGLAMRGHVRTEECLQQIVSLVRQPAGEARATTVFSDLAEKQSLQDNQAPLSARAFKQAADRRFAPKESNLNSCYHIPVADGGCTVECSVPR